MTTIFGVCLSEVSLVRALIHINRFNGCTDIV